MKNESGGWLISSRACSNLPIQTCPLRLALLSIHLASRHHVGSLAFTYDICKRLCTAYIQSPHTCTYISLDYTMYWVYPYFLRLIQGHNAIYRRKVHVHPQVINLGKLIVRYHNNQYHYTEERSSY